MESPLWVSDAGQASTLLEPRFTRKVAGLPEQGSPQARSLPFPFFLFVFCGGNA
jgi:hypothetical protein